MRTYLTSALVLFFKKKGKTNPKNVFGDLHLCRSLQHCSLPEWDLTAVVLLRRMIVNMLSRALLSFD
jgi:hypothetical protein